MSTYDCNPLSQGNTSNYLSDNIVEMSNRPNNNSRYSDLQRNNFNNSDALNNEGNQSQTGFVSKVYNKLMQIVYFIIPPGSILSGAFNMAATSIGAGILGLPSATEGSGVILAVVIIVIITLYAVLAMYALAVVVEKTGIKSFEGMAHWLFPQFHNGFAYWVSLMRWFYSFSACVAYVISIGNCLLPIFNDLAERNPNNSTIHYFSTTSGNRVLTSMIWLVIMLPLVIPKHVDSLRVFSMVAVLFMLFFVVILIVHSILHGFKVNRHKIKFNDRNMATDDPDTVYLFRTGNDVLTSLGTFIFAYVCQINGLEVYQDMQPSIKNPLNFTISSAFAMVLCGSIYILICFFGYVDFGSSKLKGNSILLMYNPLDEPVVLVSYIAVLFKLCIAYPLLACATRNSIYYMIGWQIKYHTTPNRQTNLQSGASNDPTEQEMSNTSGHNGYNQTGQVNREEVMNKGQSFKSDFDNETTKHLSIEGSYKSIKKESNMSTKFNDSDEEFSFIDNIPFWKHLIVVLALAVFSLLCGLFIPKINTVLGYAGSLSGGFVAFVCPALYYMYAGNFGVHEVGWFLYLSTYSLLLCGVIGIVFGTCGTIYDNAEEETLLTLLKK